jgi:protein SCO1/2
MQGARRFLLLLAALALSACGSSNSSTGSKSAARSPGSSGGLQGLVLRPAKPAPPLTLRNYTGQRVSLSAFRGKAVLVTFVYTHCPDVCPLIVSSLAAAQRQLGGRANRVQIVAVTVDPRRDTPVAIRSFLAARGAGGRMKYLVGRFPTLLPVWKAWGVGVSVTGRQITVGHSSIVYGITATGRIAVVYPSNFTPAQIVHDVPLLARG